MCVCMCVHERVTQKKTTQNLKRTNAERAIRLEIWFTTKNNRVKYMCFGATVKIWGDVKMIEPVI
jgi:hypothetical protein